MKRVTTSKSGYDLLLFLCLKRSINIKKNVKATTQRLGIREAIVATQVLVRNCYYQRKDVRLCFINYEKAFDRIQHHKLMRLLRKFDTVQKDI